MLLQAHTEGLMGNEFGISHRPCGCVQALMECDGGSVIYANYFNIDCLIAASKNLNKQTLNALNVKEKYSRCNQGNTPFSNT